LIEKLLAEDNEIPLLKKSADLSKATKAELKRLNIDETFFNDAQLYMIDPNSEVQITTQ
jgi:hypothetical protein